MGTTKIEPELLEQIVSIVGDGHLPLIKRILSGKVDKTNDDKLIRRARKTTCFRSCISLFHQAEGPKAKNAILMKSLDLAKDFDDFVDIEYAAPAGSHIRNMAWQCAFDGVDKNKQRDISRLFQTAEDDEERGKCITLLQHYFQSRDH